MIAFDLLLPGVGTKPASPNHRGLYVLGFGDITRGNLRGLRLDAKKVAASIKRRLNNT